MDPDLKRRMLQRCQQLGLRPYEDTPRQPEGVRSDRRETTAREAGASTSSSEPRDPSSRREDTQCQPASRCRSPSKMATPTTLADRFVLSALFPEDVSPRVYYKRHASGNVLSSQTRQCVLNVYSWIRRQYQEKNVVEVINLTAAATGISVSSVYEIKRGFKRANGAVKSPSKKRPKLAEKRKRIANHDTCTLTAVRSCLHNFFRRVEIPTLKKIATRLQEDDVLTSCSGTTLYSLLKDMGFEKQKRNRNSFLIERQDIVEWRRWYLGAIGKHRAQNRKIYFQDET
ncbi:hypothetical protein HPB47_026138 [Ixodes persulcatus]|uniref:Uncharacterized protein n=1 Tax=Ixodes persulcatus TaxID=34615 RepID=A0AC60PZR8_IXOPE|nr:hypothetical protein HPB47_026138 [Ixodes persulcatus]